MLNTQNEIDDLARRFSEISLVSAKDRELILRTLADFYSVNPTRVERFVRMGIHPGWEEDL